YAFKSELERACLSARRARIGCNSALRATKTRTTTGAPYYRYRLPLHCRRWIPATCDAENLGFVRYILPDATSKLSRPQASALPIIRSLPEQCGCPLGLNGSRCQQVSSDTISTEYSRRESFYDDPNCFQLPLCIDCRWTNRGQGTYDDCTGKLWVPT